MAERDAREPVFMISVAAQLTSLHPQTVRLYERMGFARAREIDFHPAPDVTIKGYRLSLADAVHVGV